MQTVKKKKKKKKERKILTNNNITTLLKLFRLQLYNILRKTIPQPKCLELRSAQQLGTPTAY